MVFLTETISIKSHFKKLDKVIVSITTALLVIAVLDPNQLTESIIFIGEALRGIFIFLLASVLLASFAKTTGLDQQISMVFSGHPFKAIIVASIFGALSPFCSCGVVPIIAGLLMAGVPLAPVMAFCFASPLMDPSMFLLMLPVFGLEFTLAKLIFAIIIAITAGVSLHYFKDHPLLSSPLRDLRAKCCTSSCGSASIIENKVIVWQFWKDKTRTQIFWSEGISSTWFLLRWLALAFLIESVMTAYIPAETIGGWLGVDAWWAIPSSVILGVPAYLNGYAAIPTLSGLMELGMLPGAVMGFIIAGGVSSIPAAMAVYALVKKPIFLFYIMWGLSGSLASAYLFHLYLGFFA
ncbi:permease [Rhodospirillaceae bacterium]|nr:permease [Rhodospirillaceae bacterium]